LNTGWLSHHDGSTSTYATAGYTPGELLRTDFPEVQEVTRLRTLYEMRFQQPGHDEFIVENVYATDTSVFNLFTFHFIEGNAKTALPDRNSIVLSRKAAMKYFNRTDVLNEIMRWYGPDTVDFKVTGVVEDYPDNTHLRFDLMVKLAPPAEPSQEWFEFPYMTFFTVHPQTNIASLEDKFRKHSKQHVSSIENEIGFEHLISFTRFDQIRLHSHMVGENNPQASQIYLFLSIGLFVLMMACINFINLSTARSVRRSKEIGIRKVTGAVKSQLIRQFIGEAFVLTMLSVVLAVTIVYLLLPVLNSFAGKNLQVLSNVFFWELIALIVVTVTLLAGAYPAFVLASFRPAETLKNNLRGTGSGSFLRKSLVVFQFGISVSLIAGTLIAMSHLRYLRSKSLGFDKEHVVVVVGANKNTREQLLNIPGVTKTSLSNRVPGGRVGGRTIINGWDKSDPLIVLGQLVVDYDYIDLYGLEVVAGRAFSRDIPSDETEAFMINEDAAMKLGYESPEAAIGGKLWLDGDWGGKKGTIIGVLKDFHFNAANAPIEPFSMFMNPGATRFLSIKLDKAATANLPDMISRIEETYRATVPNRPFNYSFLDEDFDRLYRAEDRFMTIFSIFASVGILIGCLGLYGLAAFMAEQRTKEVGIRKVLGATGGTILVLLTYDFMKLVWISFVIALPVAYFGMNKWLESYPYREEINPLIFVLTGIAVIGIAAISVGYQAMRASQTNPVQSLRAQ
jgi:putative ABC transport system permease protein